MVALALLYTMISEFVIVHYNDVAIHMVRLQSIHIS